MTRFPAVALAALLAAMPIQAQAQERELLQFGFGIIGHAIQQSQRPAQQPRVVQQAPSVRVAPVAVTPKVAPVPAPLPSFRLAQADAIEAPAVAPGDQVVTMDHNGSLMEIRTADMLVTITYARPRDGLAQAGVTPGTRLFQGAVVNGQLMGDAFAFKRGCAPAAYPVAGEIGAAGDLVLIGDGPVRSGCTVIRLDPASPHSRLGFSGEQAALVALLMPPAEIEAEPVPVVAVLPPVQQIAPAPVVAPPPSPVAVTPVVEQQATPIVTPPAPQPVPVIVADPAPSLPTPSVPAVTPAPAPKPVPVVETPAPPKLALDIDF
jgi:hypothetical protein